MFDRCLLFVVYDFGGVCVVCCLMVVVRCLLLFVTCCVFFLFVGRCLLLVVCW